MIKLANFKKDNQAKTIVEEERAVRNTIVLVPVDDCTDCIETKCCRSVLLYNILRHYSFPYRTMK